MHCKKLSKTGKIWFRKENEMQSKIYLNVLNALNLI